MTTLFNPGRTVITGNALELLTLKVTAAQVAEIRTLLEQGKTQEEVASMFGIKQVTVSAIKRGKTWK